MENRFPGGSWPVMLTPFTEDNKIDYDGLKELVDWYIQTVFPECLPYVSQAKCFTCLLRRE